MKSAYTLLATCLVAILPIWVHAQCPPPGFPDPGNTCVQAPILCEDLDGYCSTINNNNITQSFPGCPGWTLNNDEWFAFFAGTTSISIQITPTNCTPGQNGNVGLQGGIYEGCGPPWNAVDLQCSCTEDPFILSSNNFVVGQVYWIVMDGCSGSVCEYEVDVLVGSTVGAAPDDPGPITGPEIACAGQSTNYQLDPVNAATIYNWDLTPSLGSISDNDNMATVNWSTAGTADLCVDVENLCYSNPLESCITVEVLPEPTAMISGSGILCAGQMGTVDLTVDFTGDAPWEFVYAINGVPQAPITTSDNPYTLSVNMPGTITLVSVESVDGMCEGTVSGSAEITETELSSSSTVVNAECGESNGSIDVTPDGGTAPYDFNWSTGATTEDVADLAPGTYTVTITDDNGCSETLEISVGDDQITIDIMGDVTANTTCNGGNGAIDITVSPTGTYDYDWSNGETTEDIDDLEPGSYTVTVTSGVNCTGTATFTVPDEPDEPEPSATPVNTTCEESNGSIDLDVTGGVPPYTFVWSNGATTEDLDDIPAGSYTVTVTGANGCTSELTVEITNDNPPITIDGVVTANTTCNGGNGSIDITVTPPDNYTFIWSNGETTEDLDDLTPGSYTVTVSAGGACTNEATFTIPDDPDLPQIDVVITNSTCDLDNGSINISVSGGVPPYTFLWSDGSTSEDLTDIPAGSYAVTVTGANGCTNEASFTVGNDNPPIDITADITASTDCPGGNGDIDITVNPPGMYTYNWSNGATTEDLTDVPPGSYTVTVSGAGSCSNTATFVIPDEPNEPQLNAVVTNSECSLDNGSIDLTVSPGVPPYTFNWSNGATTEDLDDVPAGTYSVTVTGANGCTMVGTYTITNVDPPINITGTINANTTCVSGVGNGSIQITVTPPGNYTYLWSNGATTPNISNLEPGTYTVTVDGGGSCTQTASFTVPDDPDLPVPLLSAQNPNCGLSNGSINLSMSGGAPPYTYLWSTGATTPNLSMVPAGTYTVTVTGANDCTGTATITLDDEVVPINVNADITPASSCAVDNGAISLTLDPPNATVTWSTGSTSPNLTNLAPGTYTVTISAGGSCTQVQTYEVPDIAELPVIAYDVFAATCGFNNGSIDIEVFGGATPYTYQWSNNASSEDLNNLPAGNYAVTVTTALGCTAVEFFNVVMEDIGIFVSGVASDNFSCTPPNNGFIDIDVSPPGNPYTYLWSNNFPTEDLNNLGAGVYTVTVSWGSCVGVASFDVLDSALPPNLSTAVTQAICGQDNGAIDLTPSGASPPYFYQWSNNATSQDISNLAPGTYTVTVSDFFDCSATATATVTTTNIALNITGTSSDNTSCLTPNGGIDIDVSPAGMYTFTWSNAETTEDLSNVGAGTYTVTVSAGGPCTATATFTVDNNTVDPELSADVTASICSQDNGAIDLSVGNGTAPYTFDWSNMATTEDINNLLPGLYSVTVVDDNGCSADTTLDVPNNASTFSLSGMASPLTDCAADNGAVDLTVTPAGPYTYLWSNAETTEDISNLPAGTYTVSVTESGSCTASATFIVPDNLEFPSLNQSVSPEICGLQDGGVDLTVSGGTAPFTYDWDNGETTEDLTNLMAGTYTVIVTGANNCTATATATVPSNDITFSLSGTPAGNTSCIAGNGSIDLQVTPAGTYTYTWSNGPATEDLANLDPGMYTVTVSAGGTCTSTSSYIVVDNAQDPLLAHTSSPALCGQTSGGLNLTVSSGEAPFTFNWSSGQVTEDISNIPAGTYSVTVTGNNGCTATGTYDVIDDVIIPNISGVVSPNTACVSFNGAINLSVNPTLSYTYSWSSGQTIDNLSNLQPGVYTVTVNGGGSCIATEEFTVPDNAGSIDVTGVPVDILCFGANTGSIDVTPTGGNLPYTYNWSPAVAGNPQDPAGILAGDYTVTVTGALGCTGTASFTINQPATGVQVQCQQTSNVSQPGANDGEAGITISGGTSPYVVEWNPGSMQSNVPAGQFPITDLLEGQYDVTVTDANGCTVICNFQITTEMCETTIGTMSGVQLSNCGPGCVTAVYDDLGQFLDPDDVLQFVLHEGTGNQIVNEIGRSDQPEFCFDPGLMQYGTVYYISAVAGDNDGNGNVILSDFCTVVSTGTPIVFREQPVATIAPPAILNCIVDQVELQGSVDLPGATVVWETGNGQIIGNPNQASIFAGSAGDYIFIGNLNGCSDTATVEVLDITNQPNADIIASPDDVLDCVINEIVLSGTIEGSLDANAVWFSDGQIFANGTTLLIDTAGTYTFIIQDTISFCTDTATITIGENELFPPLFIDPPGFLNCLNPSVTLTGGSPVSGIEFQWATISGSDTTILGSGTSFPVTGAGTFYIIGIDPVNGCTNILDVTVDEDFDTPTASAGADFTIDCFGEIANLDGTGSTGLPGLQFAWTTQDGSILSGPSTPSPQIDQPGTYLLIVTNPGNGCTDSDDVQILPEAPIATLTAKDPPCEGERGTIIIDTVVGGQPPIMYSIDNGVTFTNQNIFQNLDPGNYTIMVEDANGCTTSVDAVINDPVPFEIAIDTEQFIKLGDTIQLNAEVPVDLQDIDVISWTPPYNLSCDTCLNPLAYPEYSTQYHITVITKEGCEDRAPVRVIVDRRVNIYVPNIFSPNGDGKDDLFMIFAEESNLIREIKTFQVFSRWGELVHEYYNFQPNDPVHGWDGTFNGEELNPAVFVWYAVVEFIDGREVLYEGDVTIKR